MSFVRGRTRRAGRLASASARSLGGYFTDGARLLHVRGLSLDGLTGVVVEDCRTLSLFYASLGDFEGMRLRPVTVAETRP